MAIKVTLGEAKQQEITQFPKIVKSSSGSILLILNEPNEEGTCKAVYLSEYSDEPFVEDLHFVNGVDSFIEFQGTITIQNT